MTEEADKAGAENLGEQIEEVERSLKEAAESAAAAEERAIAEVRALETDLEEERRRSAQVLEELRAAHAAELQSERDAKERAITAAEDRLAEIEARTDTAERRVEEAERRAKEAESSLPAAEARARESAATWLRGQIETIRREVERR